MAPGYTYDAGLLIAAERGDRAAWVLHRRALARGVDLTVPAAVLAQAWRGGPQAQLARLLQGVEVDPLIEVGARSAGALCGLARTSDAVDASVVTGALGRGDVVVTSDVDDLRRLAEAAGRSLRLRRI